MSETGSTTSPAVLVPDTKPTGDQRNFVLQRASSSAITGGFHIGKWLLTSFEELLIHIQQERTTQQRKVILFSHDVTDQKSGYLAQWTDLGRTIVIGSLYSL